MKELVDKLQEKNVLTKKEFVELLDSRNASLSDYLFGKATSVRNRYYGNDVFIRGLIEISNICKNNCFYCGIRCANGNIQRYRLSKEEILDSCDMGYKLGFRTFVMQGGEDLYYNDERMVDIIGTIRSLYPDCAITLSLGEKSYESYLAYFQAGADRYLLRHETANADHYKKLHPTVMSLDNRKRCLWDLKRIGYQTGTGFMVGSPFQTNETIAEDLLFINELKPEMVGIGPFIPHRDTIFANEEKGSVELTLFLLAIIRLMLPRVLLPVTTALSTLDPAGREKAVGIGANVIMPNLSPPEQREKYMIYDNKMFTGVEASESIALLEKQLNSIGYRISVSRGDFKKEI